MRKCVCVFLEKAFNSFCQISKRSPSLKGLRSELMGVPKARKIAYESQKESYFFPEDYHRDLKTGPKVGPGSSAQNLGIARSWARWGLSGALNKRTHCSHFN